MPQLEGPTTKNIQLCTGGLWGEKGKNEILKKKKKESLSKALRAQNSLYYGLFERHIRYIPATLTFTSFITKGANMFLKFCLLFGCPLG